MVQIQRLNVSLSQGCRGQIKRNHTKPFPNAVRGEPRTAFLYISEKEYANEPQKYQTGGRIHTDDFVRRLPRGIFGRKGRRAETAANSGQPVTRKNEVIAM